MLYRTYQDLAAFLKPNKINIIYGPRQVGKTTLIQSYIKSLKNTRILNKTGDELELAGIFNELSIALFKKLLEEVDLLVIDEAQLIPNIGRGLKIIKDHFPEVMVIVTGSASFDLVNKIGEPLTGRDNILYLFPISQHELKENSSKYELSAQKQKYLIYGSYPEVITVSTQKEKITYLNNLINSYLLKDVLALERVKGAKVILDLLRLVAFQIGGEVSTTELSSKLSLDYKTVARYLDLLEKSFVLTNIRGFSRNLRKEISKSSRYYFWDNGVRNALIQNFNNLELRNDVGQLWENFLVIERLKKQNYTNMYSNNYFWRTHDQKEIDWIEEAGGEIKGYEFKWGKKLPKAPQDFIKTYQNSSYQVINQENYLGFVL